MKALFSSFTILSLFLVACGSDITVATDEEIDAYSEAKPVMLAWQGLSEAAEANDCSAALEYVRLTLNVEESDCPALFDYFTDGAPEVDWSRTEWSASNGKAKIYAKEGGSITSFIHNEADDSWRTDERFWE